MLDINFNPFPVIETERLLLRRLRENDAEEMLFLRSDESMMRYIDRPRLNNKEEAIEKIISLHEFEAANEGINWAITIKGDEKMIGTVCLFNFEKENYRAELGYLLHPDHQGKGMMYEATSAILKYGFESLRLHSVEADIISGNTASIRVLERLNFVREAYFKEKFFFNGMFMDSAVYTLLARNFTF
jgi:[ribosomal protein S5]-alanine N-acetyltransferase